MNEAIGAGAAHEESISIFEPELSTEHLEALEKLLEIDPDWLDLPEIA